MYNLHVAYLIKYYVTAEVLGEMLKDDFADMYAKKILFCQWGGRAECQACADSVVVIVEDPLELIEMKSCYNLHNEHHFIIILRKFNTCKL